MASHQDSSFGSIKLAVTYSDDCVADGWVQVLVGGDALTYLMNAFYSARSVGHDAREERTVMAGLKELVMAYIST